MVNLGPGVAREREDMEEGTGAKGAGAAEEDHFEFHHVQCFANSLLPLQYYKDLEARLNNLANTGHFDPFSGGMRFLEPDAHLGRVQEGRSVWEASNSGAQHETSEYLSHGQDLAEQLVVGLGWRVTAENISGGTRTLLVTSSDPCGVKVCITAPHPSPDRSCNSEGTSPASTPTASDSPTNEEDNAYDHFSLKLVERFKASHSQRQCVGVLGFEVALGALDAILERYRTHHPALLLRNEPSTYSDSRTIGGRGGKARTVELGRMRVLEVFAYYIDDAAAAPDHGTVLRFVERTGKFARAPGFANPEGVLPGLHDVDAHFDGTSIPAYWDHWVSNVRNRLGFLNILKTTLGFVPKVEFNAGVVAAGEAKIESTVVGNSSTARVMSEADALRNQTQVYLPVNNSLSHAGHVEKFLAEMGQGVQHLASRVEDLVSFVERVNNYRAITKRGFSFLSIPRSYYGVLTPQHLQAHADISEGLAEAVMSALQDCGLVSASGVVDLAITEDCLSALSLEYIPAAYTAELEEHKVQVWEAVSRGRYRNLYLLLRDQIPEKLYLQIVRNQILVDIQGEDCLLQIFTCKILQEHAGDEAPFLEFIQRVCKECRDGECGTKMVPIKPGCGGFGIRNFLTLFLSMEVSKAISDQEDAVRRKDKEAEKAAARSIHLLTCQLDESNPILTEISDAMTAHALALTRADTAQTPEEKAAALADAKEVAARKDSRTQDLQALAEHYRELAAAAPALASKGS